jgi:hypothetical protein
MTALVLSAAGAMTLMASPVQAAGPLLSISPSSGTSSTQVTVTADCTSTSPATAWTTVQSAGVTPAWDLFDFASSVTATTQASVVFGTAAATQVVGLWCLSGDYFTVDQVVGTANVLVYVQGDGSWSLTPPVTVPPTTEPPTTAPPTTEPPTTAPPTTEPPTTAPPTTVPPTTEPPTTAPPTTAPPTTAPPTSAPLGSVEFGALKVGELQTFNGEGFDPGETVDFVVFSTPTPVGESTAGNDGSVTHTFVVPEALEPGQHTVVATGQNSGVEQSATFVVEASDDAEVAPTSSPTGDENLADTGGNLLTSGLTGLALLLVGLGLLAGTRLTRNAKGSHA